MAKLVDALVKKTGNLKFIKGLLQQKLKKCNVNALVGGSNPPRLLRGR